MSKTAAERLAAAALRAETRAEPRLSTIQEHEEELRTWNIHADDKILPLTPVARKIFVTGTTVFAHLRPSMPFPNDYAFALAELCACYRHGLIAIGPHPLPPL